MSGPYEKGGGSVTPSPWSRGSVYLWGGYRIGVRFRSRSRSRFRLVVRPAKVDEIVHEGVQINVGSESLLFHVRVLPDEHGVRPEPNFIGTGSAGSHDAAPQKRDQGRKGQENVVSFHVFLLKMGYYATGTGHTGTFGH